jgi:enoyl-CoA hydratase/carnithine racemase
MQCARRPWPGHHLKSSQRGLTSDAISAEETARIGLVNGVVAPGTQRDQALAIAHRIAAKSRHVVKNLESKRSTGRSTWS